MADDSLLLRSGKANIVLLVIDSGRPDRFSSYGHNRATTPNMDALAEKGVVFENAYTVDTASPLSHFGLMSGQSDWSGRGWLDDAGVGARAAFLFRRTLRRLGISDYVGGYDHERHSLLKLLKGSGYYTLGISANQLVSPATLQAYDGFDAFPEKELFEGLETEPIIKKRLKSYGIMDSKANRQAVYLRADRVMELARKRILVDNPEFQKPFFLFMNLMDCHDPYLVHEDFEEDFGFQAKSTFNGDLRNRPGVSRKAEGEQAKGPHWTNSRDLDADTVELLRWNYDRCLGYVDMQMAKMMKWLDEKGQLNKTVFLILADHAEQLGENGFFTHSMGASEEQLHIPMIVSGEGFVAPGQRRSERVSIVDVRPTIMELLGVEDPFTQRSGLSLLSGERKSRPMKAWDSGALDGDRNQKLLGEDRAGVSAKELEVMEERLRDLGYMD